LPFKQKSKNLALYSGYLLTSVIFVASSGTQLLCFFVLLRLKVN